MKKEELKEKERAKEREKEEEKERERIKMLRKDLEYSSSDEETLKQKFSKKYEKARQERIKQREKEKEEDQINARKEFELMFPGVATAEEKLKQAEEIEQKRRENEEEYQLGEHKDIEIKVSLTEELKIAPKPLNKNFGAQEDDEEDPLYKRTHKPLELPAIFEETPKPVPQPEITINEETYNAKLKHYKNLLEKVPRKRKELYAFNLSWNALAQNRILEKKLGPFISKLLVEYVGQDDRNLVQMVTRMVVNRDDPDKIEKNLAKFLEEEAQVISS